MKTVVFKKEKNTVQGTFVLDQRTKNVVELDYQVLPQTPKVFVEIVVKPIIRTYTTVTTIKKVFTTNTFVMSTISTVSSIDSTLESMTPTYVHYEEYAGSVIITSVYDTPKSNSRVLIVYNKKTKESKVIDYTKIAKNIEGSTVIESVNEYGHKQVFTDRVESIKKTKEYTSVVTVAEEMMPVIKGKPISGIETTVMTSGTQYKIVTVDQGVVNQVVLHYNRETEEVTFVDKKETSISTEVLKVVNQNKKQQVVKIDIETLQSSVVKDVTKVFVKENKEIFSTHPVIQSGTVTKTDLVEIYELNVETKEKKTKTVKVTKDIKTSKIIVNDIRPIVELPEVRPQIIVTQSDNYGNIVKTVTSKKVIKESKEIQKVIKQVYIEKPQLINLPAVSVNTVTYGDIEETTIVFAKEKKTTIQTTTVTNKKTKKVTILGTKILPVVYEPSKPIECVPPRIIPQVFIEKIKKTSVEVQKVTKKVETINSKVVEIAVVDLGEVKKYTTIVQTDSGKEQNVIIYHKETKKVEVVQTTIVKEKVKKVFHQTVVNKFGETVTTCSSTDLIVKEVPQVTEIIKEINNKYDVDVSSTTKIVEAKGTTIK